MSELNFAILQQYRNGSGIVQPAAIVPPPVRSFGRFAVNAVFAGVGGIAIGVAELGAISAMMKGTMAIRNIAGVAGYFAEGATLALAGVGTVAIAGIAIIGTEAVTRAARKIKENDPDAIYLGMSCGAILAGWLTSAIPTAISTIGFVGAMVAGTLSVARPNVLRRFLVR